MAELKRAFICGWPVEHSRSPIIHNFWINKYGLQGEYIKHPVSPSDFDDFVLSLHNGTFLGGNVTIPHKEMAFKLIKNLDPVAKRLGAVNTIWIEDGEIHAANTDGYGFLANLDQLTPNWDDASLKQKKVIVLGAGGAARAIIDAVQSRGFTNISIVNRTYSRAENLAGFFGKTTHAHKWEDLPNLMLDSALLINTTSLGMEGKSPLEIDLSPLPSNCLVSDIVYVPLKTELLQQAENLGLKIAEGLGMLLHQAVPGFEKWFGIRPEVSDELRALVVQDLEQNS